MKQSYKDIASVLEDFSNSYNDLKALSNDLASALRGTIQTVSEDITTDIAIKSTDISDMEYVKTIASAIKSRDPLSTLRIYASCIDELKGMIDSREATVAKLQERISLQDGGSPEVKVAINKRARFNGEIEILKERIKFCMEKFYNLRKSMLVRIIQYSNHIALEASDDISFIARPIILKFRMPMEKLGTIDGRIMEDKK